MSTRTTVVCRSLFGWTFHIWREGLTGRIGADVSRYVGGRRRIVRIKSGY